jgi:hypothetical protein
LERKLKTIQFLQDNGVLLEYQLESYYFNDGSDILYQIHNDFLWSNSEKGEQYYHDLHCKLNYYLYHIEVSYGF